MPKKAAERPAKPLAGSTGSGEASGDSGEKAAKKDESAKTETAMVGLHIAVPGAVAVVAVLAGLVANWEAATGFPTVTEAIDELGTKLLASMYTDVVGFALPLAYSRWAVSEAKEHWFLTHAFAIAVGGAGLYNLRQIEAGVTSEWTVLFAVQAASYVFALQALSFSHSILVNTLLLRVPAAAAGAGAVWLVAEFGLIVEVAKLAVAVCLAGIAYRVVRRFVRTLSQPIQFAFQAPVLLACLCVGWLYLPEPVMWICRTLWPIDELVEATLSVADFVGREHLRRTGSQVMIVTFNVQVALGFQGIAMLRRGQDRRNALFEVADGKMTAPGFMRTAVLVYVLTYAMPYMLQRTVMENVNYHAFQLFLHDVDIGLRVRALFPETEGGTQITYLGAVAETNHTVEMYTDALDGMAASVYGILEKKFFGLPKLMLLPSMLASQPLLVMVVLPGAVGLDFMRVSVFQKLTMRIQKHMKKLQEMSSRRKRVEQHDTKHQELVQRTGATALTADRWLEMNMDQMDLRMKCDTLKLFRDFIQSLYMQDLLGPGIEVALAYLLSIGHITISDIWLYTRVVEEAIDALLTRFRKEAMLANVKTHVQRIKELTDGLVSIKGRARGATCAVDAAIREIKVQGLEYRRGTSHVQIEDLVLHAGRAYAVTGANGCGKSTLFAVLASCGRYAPMMPSGLEVVNVGNISLPSTDIVEITQQFYCPLFTRPIGWLLGLPNKELDAISEEKMKVFEDRIVEVSSELNLRAKRGDSHRGEMVDSNEIDKGGLTKAELWKEKEDWYSELSGGQRVKIEFMRHVFLREKCPGIILIDEAFAPLDPVSKSLVQDKLKAFCSESVILTIHHTDVDEHCIQRGFFDDNLHFEEGSARLIGTCQSSEVEA